MSRSDSTRARHRILPWQPLPLSFPAIGSINLNATLQPVSSSLPMDTRLVCKREEAPQQSPITLAVGCCSAMGGQALGSWQSTTTIKMHRYHFVIYTFYSINVLGLCSVCLYYILRLSFFIISTGRKGPKHQMASIIHPALIRSRCFFRNKRGSHSTSPITSLRQQ